MEEKNNGALNEGGEGTGTADTGEEKMELKSRMNRLLTDIRQKLRESNDKIDFAWDKIVSMEEKIRRVETNWVTSFNAVEDGVVIISRDYIIEGINKTGLEYFGVAADEVVGKKCHKVLRGELSVCGDCPLEKCIYTGKVEKVELFDKKLNRYFAVTGSPIYDDNGNVVRFIDTLRDITEVKRKDADLRDYSQKLDKMVLELKEAHEEFLKNEKLSVLGMLAGGVGHELRNPLGAIKNSSYFLNMALSDADGEIKESLGIIEDGIADSETIIRKLDDFASPSPPQMKKIHVGKIVETVLSEYPLPERISLETKIPDGIPLLLTDPAQIAEIFGNIVLNAAQAMPGGGRLEIEARVAGRGRWLETVFTDEGSGIHGKDLRKIFKPLYTTLPRGFGLGLVHSKKLVENNGGYIDVKSEPEKGSVFTVRLPLS